MSVLATREPGTYRVYADFQLDGEKRTLATDVFVPGDFQPNPLPEAAATDATAGYDVELRSGDVRAGEEGGLSFAVTRDGRPVEDLQFKTDDRVRTVGYTLEVPR
jgi:hypothetical protein